MLTQLTQAAAIEVVLMGCAMVPLLIHPKVKHNANRRRGYLLGMQAAVALIMAITFTPHPADAVIPLVAYWALVAYWTNTALDTRKRKTEMETRERREREPRDA